MPKDVPIAGKGLRFESVNFTLRDNAGNEIDVRFSFDQGKPEIVAVFLGESEEAQYIEDNRDGSLKPCMTHVLDLIRRLTHKPPKSQHAKRRDAGGKPELRVFQE